MKSQKKELSSTLGEGAAEEEPVQTDHWASTAANTCQTAIIPDAIEKFSLLGAIALCVCATFGCGNRQRNLDIQQFYKLAAEIDTAEISVGDSITAGQLNFSVDDTLSYDKYLQELHSICTGLRRIDSAWSSLEQRYNSDRHLDSARILHAATAEKTKSVQFLARHALGQAIAWHYDFAKGCCESEIQTWNDCIQASIDFSGFVGVMAGFYRGLDSLSEESDARIAIWVVVFSPDTSSGVAASEAHKFLEDFLVETRALKDLSCNPRGSLWTFRGEVRELSNKAAASYSHFKLANAKTLR